MNDFDEVEDIEENKNYFMKSGHLEASSGQWQNKLNLQEKSEMNNRHVQIKDIQLVSDG